MKNLLLSLFLLLTLNALPASAGATPRHDATQSHGASQSHAEIRDTVTKFVQAQTKGVAGNVSIQVTEIDRRIALPVCTALEAFLPPGTQLNGNTTVGVRCNSKQGWSLFVQVNVKINVTMLTTNKTLQQGQTVRAEDLGTLSSESLQAGTLTDPAQAVGKIMKYGVGAGQILRHNMLRAPYTVTQGQSVQLHVPGAGFRVSAEGRALSNAAEGETTTARTVSGQTVSGVVKGGVIEISQ